RINKRSTTYDTPTLPTIKTKEIRTIIDQSENGYLSASDAFELLELSGIKCVKQAIISNKETAVKYTDLFGFPLVMKVSGPLHKSDVGGVVIGVNSKRQIEVIFDELMEIEDAEGVLIQQQITGNEIYIGAKKEGRFGHQI